MNNFDIELQRETDPQKRNELRMKSAQYKLKQMGIVDYDSYKAHKTEIFKLIEDVVFNYEP